MTGLLVGLRLAGGGGLVFGHFGRCGLRKVRCEDLDISCEHLYGIQVSFFS